MFVRSNFFNRNYQTLWKADFWSLRVIYNVDSIRAGSFQKFLKVTEFPKIVGKSQKIEKNRVLTNCKLRVSRKNSFKVKK